jgi:putative transposase
MSHELAFGIIGFDQTKKTERDEHMTQIHLTLEEEILKELMLGNKEDAVAKLLEKVFDSVLQGQASEQLNADPYERTDDRTSYRNGYRTRQLTTRVGTLILHVPKFRDGTFSTELFERYQRSEKALLLSLMEMVIQGVSTRKVSEITETLCGTSFSKSTVSALCQNLDPIVEAFRNRPLERHYPFLIVDAIYMKARNDQRVKSRGVLIATGVNNEGNREVLGFTIADGESEQAWGEFFESLKLRGLKAVDLVTSDDHSGLKNAIQKKFHGVAWQRCQTHFSKNLLDKVPKKLRAEVKANLTDLYNAPELQDAKIRKDRMLEMYCDQSPKAMELLDDAFDEITAVYALPQPYRKRLRTSNSIERLNEELRRRERVIRIFPNDQSLIRLMGAVLMEHHEKWINGKKYFDMTCYEEESDEARRQVLAQRSAHLQVVK